MIVPGTELEGRYRVVRLLGEGAMGAVYEAEQLRLARRVAVKVMHPQFAHNAEAVERFWREAGAAALIGHPGIVEAYDVGMFGAQPFLAMELLDGETLAERITRDEVLALGEACDLVGQLLSALGAAHAAGIVHRDLKPANVFLTPSAAGPRVRLLDFGVSKILPPDGVPRLTKDGRPIGTPAFMSPEQWMGQLDADHRADLFATGVMLYLLLTGAFPYEGETRDELFAELLVSREPPPAPSALNPSLPPALDAVVLRALERERERRYASAAEFLAALRPFGAGADAAVDRAPRSEGWFRRWASRVATAVGRGRR